METAFEVIMNLQEYQLKHIFGDLESHKLYYKNICIFDGVFHLNPAADFSNITELLPNQHIYSQNEWLALFEKMYKAYASCQPKSHKHLNFIPADVNSLNELTTLVDFHHRRVILDLFVIFGYHARLFTWDNPNYFMLHVCNNCIVHRDWLI